MSHAEGGDAYLHARGIGWLEPFLQFSVQDCAAIAVLCASCDQLLELRVIPTLPEDAIIPKSNANELAAIPTFLAAATVLRQRRRIWERRRCVLFDRGAHLAAAPVSLQFGRRPAAYSQVRIAHRLAQLGNCGQMGRSGNSDTSAAHEKLMMRAVVSAAQAASKEPAFLAPCAPPTEFSEDAWLAKRINKLKLRAAFGLAYF